MFEGMLEVGFAEIERIGQRDDALIVASNELSEGMSYVARGAFFLKSKQTFGQ